MCELTTWLLGSVITGFLCVGTVKNLALRWNWLDVPNERSLHFKPTPRSGGAGILITAMLGLIVQVLSSRLDMADPILWIFYPSLFVAAISLVDDFKDMPRSIRILGHTLSAIFVLWIFHDIWLGQPLPLLGTVLPGFVCLMLFLMWLAGLTNAYNFMDGIDGIAAIQGVVAILGWCSVLLFGDFSGNSVGLELAIFPIVLAGGLLGFLVQNWAPAKVFMGDTGSTFLGFFLASMPFAMAGLGMPLDRALESGVFFVWPFVADSSFTFVRRLIAREPVFKPHRTHLYQKLAASFDTREAGHRITSLTYGLLALVGVGLYWSGGPLWAKLVVLFWIWTAIFLWIQFLRPKSSPSVKMETSGGNFDIYLAPPDTTEVEIQQVLEAIDSGYIAPVGPQVDAFESKLSDYLGLDDIQAVNCGTAAIHVALRALGVGPGKCVLCPDLTFIASVNPVRYLGAEACLIDVNPENWAMDVDRAREAIRTLRSEGKNIQAIVAVHAYGIPAPMDSIMELASSEGIKVLEDCAGAFGSMIGDRHVGSFGDAAAFSFNGNKILTTSGGGALYVKDPAMRMDSRSWTNQGKSHDAANNNHEHLGYNYRLSNISAAIGLGQLSTVQQRLDRKKSVFETYQECLSGMDGVTFMPQPDYGRSNNWLSCIGTDSREHTNAILNALRGQRIEAVSIWRPMHLQKINAGMRCFGGEVSEFIASHYLSIPSGSQLTEGEIGKICEIIRKAG